MEPENRKRPQLAGAIWGLGVVMPGLAAAGTFPGFELLPLVAWLALAAAAGAGGTVLAVGRRRTLAAVLGGLGGAGSIFAIPLYVALRSQLSERFFMVELVVPMALVGLPLLAVWRLVDRRPTAAKPKVPSELAQAAARTQEAPDRSLCARHPQTVARWACGRCGSFFCPLCARYPAENDKPVCEACAPGL
jgi:hypothetical protein